MAEFLLWMHSCQLFSTSCYFSPNKLAEDLNVKVGDWKFGVNFWCAHILAWTTYAHAPHHKCPMCPDIKMALRQVALREWTWQWKTSPFLLGQKVDYGGTLEEGRGISTLSEVLRTSDMGAKSQFGRKEKGKTGIDTEVLCGVGRRTWRKAPLNQD